MRRNAVYQSARGTIRSGDLLAWQGDGLIGRLIRSWTGETYSHVGIAFVLHGRVAVTHAREGRGVGLVALSNCLPVYHIAIDIKWNAKLSKAMMESWDQPYSYLDAIKAGLGFATNKTNGWQCAEYAADLLIKAGRLNEADRSENTPGKLVARVLKTGSSLRLLTEAEPVAQTKADTEA